MSTELRDSASLALAEIGEIFEKMDGGEIDHFCEQILDAKTIHCFGLGREGLMIRAFCMRLMHLGLDAHMIGDVTSPCAGGSDLLIVCSGPGDHLMCRSMIQLGRQSTANVLVITAQPDGPDPLLADVVITLPAQTMADDRDSERVLLMGTAFEFAMLLFFDLTANRLRELTGQTTDGLRGRHTNLE